MLREIIEQIEKLPQKTMFNTMLTNTDLPIIGVVVENNEISLTDSNNYEAAKYVCDGVRANNATAKIVSLPSIDCTANNDTAGAKYDLPQRDLVADNVELIASTEMYDGIVFVTSQPNVAAGMLLGAIRLNIPCAFVFGGTMQPINTQGKLHGMVDVCRQITRIKYGKTELNQTQVAQNCPPIAGTDCERYGQSSFNCVLEALGLAVSGASTVSAQSYALKQVAFETGKTIVNAANDKLSPRRIITASAMHDAIMADLAIEGCSTTVLNMIAVAKALGIKTFNLKAVGDIAKITPVLLQPQDNVPIMVNLQQSGGVYAVLKRLYEENFVKCEHITIMGTPLQDSLQNFVVADNSNIKKPSDKNVKQSANLRVLYGNLAEEGCICHYHGQANFEGVAKVYDSTESAIDAIMHREIRPNDVVVIKNEGPKSAPGMREVYLPFALLEGMELANKVAVITDGRIPDFYKGIAVGHITPESASQSLFAVLQDDDDIEISVTKGKISCDVKAKELQSRLRSFDNASGNYANRYLRKWSKAASNASEGCVTE